MLLFHGTDADFTSFEERFLAPDDKHANGALGVWLATMPTLACGFGKWTLAVEVAGDRIFDMSVRDLRKLAELGMRDPEGSVVAHQRLAAQIRDAGYHFIAIRESDGSAPTMIAIRPEDCRIVERIESRTDQAGLDRFTRMAMETFALRGIEPTDLERSFSA